MTHRCGTCEWAWVKVHVLRRRKPTALMLSACGLDCSQQSTTVITVRALGVPSESPILLCPS